MNEGTLKYIDGDVTKPQRDKDQIIIIPHVCNNRGGYGAGVALAIAKRWPSAEFAYQYYYEKQLDAYDDDDSPVPIRFSNPKTDERIKKAQKAFLGSYSHAEIKDELIYICNMVAQDGYRSKDNPIPLKYTALEVCMKEVGELALFYDAEIHCPKFGSDLAGGHWEVIEGMIKELWVKRGINVIVYNFFPAKK
jgi:hypothetical protein